MKGSSRDGAPAGGEGGREGGREGSRGGSGGGRGAVYLKKIKMNKKRNETNLYGESKPSLPPFLPLTSPLLGKHHPDHHTRCSPTSRSAVPLLLPLPPSLPLLLLHFVEVAA